ncbi:response regulator transcription factor [Caulobacter sp. NIBR2454]|uniref:response regulator transcription factor n=1 Tax=Caulobacter sp. NIBR2454 TaxID=3015996 RepID=UPI0022B6F974|nr:response regulator [Caulobacter sp. NIBR2454]
MSPSPLICVIDDDPSVRAATGRLLRSLGYSVQLFASAEAWLDDPTVAAPACIVSDVQMPGMNGLELLARLRGEGRATPIIFVTAFPDERRQRQALDGGALGFLTKPFDQAELASLVALALGHG